MRAVASLFAPGGPLARHQREHIFSDNASTDGTVAILRRLAASDPSVKVILNARNFGPFRSNFNALRYATGDAVLVFLPVDLQDPPDLIPEMVRHWESGIEIVAGARVNRDETWTLRTCRHIFYRLVSTLSDFEVPENVGEFQLIDRSVWEVVVSHRRSVSLHPRHHRLGRIPQADPSLHLAGAQARHFEEQCAAADRPGHEWHFLVHQRADAVLQLPRLRHRGAVAASTPSRLWRSDCSSRALRRAAR